MGGVIVSENLLNYTRLMRLESCVSSISLNNFSNMSRKAVYQSSNVILGNLIPFNPERISKLLPGGWLIRTDRKAYLQHVSCMLDGIHIEGLCWSVHSLDALFLKVGRHDTCAVCCRFIVHQDESPPNCTGVRSHKRCQDLVPVAQTIN